MKNKAILAAVLLAIPMCTAIDAQPAQGPSFNCRYAKAPDEVAICQDPALADDDLRMSNAYFYLRHLTGEAGMTDALGALEGTQREWLAARSRCGSNPACLHRAYVARLQDFAAMRQSYEGATAEQPIAPEPQGSMTMEQDRERVIQEGKAHCERWPDDKICHFED